MRGEECEKKVIQKTLRFYDDSPDDVKALKAIDEYKSYGFTSGRELIITAKNVYIDNAPAESKQNAEDIADAIIRRMTESNLILSVNQGKEEKQNETEQGNNSIAKALEFISGL